MDNVEFVKMCQELGFDDNVIEVIVNIRNKNLPWFDDTVNILITFFEEMEIKSFESPNFFSAIDFRCFLESIFLSPYRYIGKTHLRIALAKMGFKIKPVGVNYFSSNIKFKSFETFIKKNLKGSKK